MKMADMTVQELQEAIRIAESAGDTATAEELKTKLKRMAINS